jgi:hypothetical protein
LLLVLIFKTAIGLCINQKENTNQQNDRLINEEKYVAKIVQSTTVKELQISNGLIERSFWVAPNFATIDIKNLLTLQNYLGSVCPEAKVTIYGPKFNIGGLFGQPIHHYRLAEWIEKHTNDEESCAVFKKIKSIYY